MSVSLMLLVSIYLIMIVLRQNLSYLLNKLFILIIFQVESIMRLLWILENDALLGALQVFMSFIIQNFI